MAHLELDVPDLDKEWEYERILKPRKDVKGGLGQISLMTLLISPATLSRILAEAYHPFCQNYLSTEN